MENRLISKKTVNLMYSLMLTLIAVSGLVDGYASSRYVFKYYTYQSNLLVAVIYGIQTVLCVFALKGSRLRIPVFVKGLTVLAIQVTFLTVLFLLNPFGFPKDWLDARIHYVVPLMTLVEWVLFESHGELRWYYSLCWLMAPVAYLIYVYAMVRQNVWFGVDRVPYFFLDYRTLGWGRVTVYTLLIAALVVSVGMLMVCVDHWIWRKKSS